VGPTGAAAASPSSGEAPQASATRASSTSSAVEPTASPPPTATPSGDLTASPLPTATPVPAPPADLSTCVAALFPPDSSLVPMDRLAFLCTETHARKGGTALKVEVIRSSSASKDIPQNMQEWARLGWYEMAAFALARGRCCADPVELAPPLGLDACPLDQTLEELGRAARRGDRAAAQTALSAYVKVVDCLVQAGASRAFGQGGRPSPIATQTIQTMLDRLLAPP
jgi:hypothetical protein